MPGPVSVRIFAVVLLLRRGNGHSCMVRQRQPVQTGHIVVGPLVVGDVALRAQRLRQQLPVLARVSDQFSARGQQLILVPVKLRFPDGDRGRYPPRLPVPVRRGDPGFPAPQAPRRDAQGQGQLYVPEEAGVLVEPFFR